MDCGTKTLIFFTLWALVGATRLLDITNNLEIMVSVPPTHIGDTEIVSAVLSSPAGHPVMYTIVVQKNQTQCMNSTDPRCSSLIKAPAVNVSVTSRSSDGKNFSYSCFINGSRRLVIHVDNEVLVTPQMVDGDGDNITVIIDITYDSAKTTRHTFSPRRRTTPALFGFGVQFVSGTTTTRIIQDNSGPWRGYSNPYGNGFRNGFNNGQSALSCAPVSALILLALTPLLLLQ